MSRFLYAAALACAALTFCLSAEEPKPAAPAATKEKLAPLWSDQFNQPEKSDSKTLSEFCMRLISSQRYYNDPEKMAAFMKLMAPAVLEACDKILANEKSPNSGYAHFARNAIVTTQLQALMQPGSEKLAARVISETEKLIDSPRFNTNDASPCSNALRLLQMSDPLKAKALYEKLDKALTALEDPWNEQTQMRVASALVQLGMIGKPLDIKGTAVDGKAFDLSALKGKVVLVDFWATWCGPCVGELPNVKANYEKYHAKGFEVVGIAADETREALDTFLTSRPLPWTILHEKGGRHPAMEKYDIQSYPTTFLVGKDGNVLSLDARGPRLGELLKAQLGE